MSQPLSPGTKLGRYEIRSKLSEGGMGEVYLAQDTKLNRKVALKILPAEVVSKQERMRRFAQEAKAASALNHPNIITIHEIDQADSIYFIATEFIDGRTLRECMRNAPMKLTEVLDIAPQIASALSAAHAVGIVHRDIKPENIMLRSDGIVKVLDFGLAKLTEQVSSELIDTEAPTRFAFNTEPGVVMGTALYMSPEQARGQQVDARTDIFSLGVLIYEMVAGRLPFEGSNTNEILASILSDKETPLLARYAREVPIELERIVAKALRKNRDQRYQTTKDLLLDLQSLKSEVEFERKLERSTPPKSASGYPVEPAESGTTTESSLGQTASQAVTTSATTINQRRIVVAVAALLILAVGLGAYFYFSRGQGGVISSVAVMPFVNESGNSDVDYLSDGMTESLINSLSQLPGLSVKARSAVFRYRGKNIEPQQVGSELNVRAILNGRMVQRGDDLTLYLSLVDARDGNQLWGEQYNRKLTDLVTLQHEITRDVSQKLQARLAGADEQKLAKHYTTNPEAYQLYLKGHYFFDKRTTAGVKQSIEYYQQAIKEDPNYALAYAGLADAYTPSDVMLPPRETITVAKAAATKALELDETLPEAHEAQARVLLFYDWDWSGSEHHFQRALQLNPMYAEAHHVYSHYLMNLGRTEESLAESRKALEIDPLDVLLNIHLGWYYLYVRRSDEAIDQLRKTLNTDPTFQNGQIFLGQAYEQKGMYQESLSAFQKAMTLEGNGTLTGPWLGHLYAVSGNRAEAIKTLNHLKELYNRDAVSPYDIAIVYAGLGEKDQAIEYLQKAYEKRSGGLLLLKVEPVFDDLRSDARFVDLERRIGLTQ